LFACCAAGPAAAANLNDGLKLSWKFSGNANDSSGHGYDGTVTDATLTKDRFGHPGSAYRFHAADAVITTPDAPGLDPSRITVAAWVSLDSPVGFGRAVDKYLYDAKQGYNLRYDPTGKTMAFCFWGSDALEHCALTAAPATTDRWHFYVGTYDRKEQKIYVDGKLQIRVALTTRIVQAAGHDFTVGNGNDGTMDWPLSGSVDDVRIYARALNPGEVKTLYQATK
jgi:hypothetical protein